MHARFCYLECYYFSYFLVNLVDTAKSPKNAPDTFNVTKKPTSDEFISDNFDKKTNEKDLVEIRENMTKLGLATQKDKANEDTGAAASASHKKTLAGKNNK